MSRVVGWITLALAAVACGGRAHSGDRGKDGIALPDADAGLAPGAAVPALDAGRADLGGACDADGVVHRSVEVNRQEQLDELAGCTRIAGNLSLYERNFDLTPLLSLRVVEGLLWVDGEDGPRPGGRQQVLDGFRALEQVGGLTLLRVNVTNLSALARLRRIGFDAAAPREIAPSDDGHPGVFELTSCSTFATLSGLDSLEQVAEIDLKSDQDLQRLSGLPRLRRVDRLVSKGTPLADLGDVGSFLESLDLSATALQKLTGLGDASRLRTLTLFRNRSLASLEGGTVAAQMDSVSLEDNGLVNLKGLENLSQVSSLSVSSHPESNRLETLAGLEGLVQVGTLTLQGVTTLSSLAGLRALQRADNIFISDANALPNFAGLSSLARLGNLSLAAPALSDFTGLGTLSVDYASLSNVLVSSFAGFENVSVKSLYLYGAPQLSTLNGLVAHDTLQDLSISEAPLLSDIGALSGVTELHSFGLSTTAVTNLDALSALQKLRGLYFQDNVQLSQIDAVRSVSDLLVLNVSGSPLLRALPSFDNVTGAGCAECQPFQLSIYGNDALETGPRLPALQQAGSVDVENNGALTDLTGLSALRAVDSVKIENNASLARVDLSALQSASSIWIRKNPALDDSSLARFRQMPRVRYVKIVSNGSGPARMQSCPWLADGECDELTEDCAVGTDSVDCR